MDVMSLLSLPDSREGKQMATTAVGKAFGNIITLSRRKSVYKGLKKLAPFSIDEDSTLKLDQGSEISKMKELINTTKVRLEGWRTEIGISISDKQCDNLQLKCLFDMYNNEEQKFFSYHEKLDKMYEREIKLLSEKQESTKLPQKLKMQLEKEYSSLSQSLNLGLRKNDLDPFAFVFTDENFCELRLNFRKDCPLLFDIMGTLFTIDNEERGSSKVKELSFVHALSLLMSLKNKDLKNDVKLLFSLLLLSYGVGQRLMNMLCHMRVTYSWAVVSKFLDSFIESKSSEIVRLTNKTSPLIFLIDNINMYRGSKKYLRLFKVFGPKMWNFTARGLLIPNLSGIESLFLNEETAKESQQDINSISAEDILISGNPDHSNVWENWLNYYFLSILKDALSSLPFEQDIKGMSEDDFDKWLSQGSYKEDKSKIKISPPLPRKMFPLNDITKSNLYRLTLSLENNSTVSGTGAILQELARDFGMPHTMVKETIPFDLQSNQFSLKQAREHVEFLRMMKDHESEMEEFVKVLNETDKKFQGATPSMESTEETTEKWSSDEEINTLLAEQFDLGLDLAKNDLAESYPTHENNETDIGGVQDEDIPCLTLKEKKDVFKEEDKVFSMRYDKLLNKLWNMHEQNQADQYVQYLTEKRERYINLRDHLGRSFLHIAVEQGNTLFAEYILTAGFNPNVKEHCGATPLNIAVAKKNADLCKLLIKCGAAVRGPLFGGIPSPLEMARKLQVAEIYDILNPDSSDIEDEDIMSYDLAFSKFKESGSKDKSNNSSENINRATDGFITGVVGDVGTCKSNRGVMERSSALSWVGIIPGDLHMKGAFIESCFKEQGPGGFHYLVRTVMKRPHLNEEVFKKKKFEKNNFRWIKEAVRDCGRSYAFAAVHEFKNSTYFPSTNSLRSCCRRSGNHNEIILSCFKEFLKSSLESSSAFKYRSRMFIHFAPLLELFEFSTHYNFGLGRETCYILQLPVYAHLGFRNYYTETFIHVVNFLAKWPLAFRMMLQKNSSINLSGKIGKGIEHDSWVEGCIVKPIKQSVSGHTTIKTCLQIAGSLDIIHTAREAYRGRESFDEHSTSHHSIPSPLPDQLKGAWYCISRKLMSSTGKEDPVFVDSSGNKTVVPKFLMDVEHKGIHKLTTNFTSKKFSSFPDLRFTHV